MARHRSSKLKPKYRCEACCLELPDHPKHVERHDSGDRHQRLQELLLKRPIMEAWNVRWVEKTNTYVCYLCDETMELSFRKIKQHFKAQHTLPLTTAPVLEVFKVFKRKKYYESDYDFGAAKINFSMVEGPVELKESIGNCVGMLTLNVIPKSHICRLYRIATVLKMYGNPCVRGKKKQGSKMVMYGLYENHRQGWFKHPDESLYALSELFASEITSHIQDVSASTIRKFEKNLEIEGLKCEEARFANTPFSCFSITRDYSCLPHDDPTDYGYGFIIWLYPEGEFKVQDYPIFWLPQYHVNFIPPNGSAFLMNSNTTVHCTTSQKKIGVIGIAFVQKRPLIIQTKKAIEDLSTAIGVSYLKAKKKYEEAREQHRGQSVTSQFYN